MEHLDLELAHRLLHQQLDPQTQAVWEHHLASCGRCRALLAAERNWKHVLGLAQDPAPAVTVGMEQLLARVADLAPNGAARRQRRNLLLLAGAGLATLLASLLAWQTSDRTRQSATALAQELRIPVELHSRVIANFDALATLQREPWLPERYDAVLTLEQLIRDQPP